MSRSDAKRLDDIRDVCATVASVVERGRSEVEGDDLLWAIAVRDLPAVATALGPAGGDEQPG